MHINIVVGNKIKQIRLSKGWSQEKLAQLAELDRTYLPGIEKGTRNVSLQVLERISNALGINIKDLFDEC